jgi:hypothetical protein
VNRDRQHTGSDAKQHSDHDASKTLQMQAETGIVKNSQIATFAYLENLDADFYWVANVEICAHALGGASVQR